MAVPTKVRHDLFPDESASADDNDFHGCPLAAPSVAEQEVKRPAARLARTTRPGRGATRGLWARPADPPGAARSTAPCGFAARTDRPGQPRRLGGIKRLS